MNNDIKQRWVEALRSGRYTQTKGVLACDQGMCCLGVLLDVAGQLGEVSYEEREVGFWNRAEGKSENIKYTNIRSEMDKQFEISMPTDEFLDRVGLSEELSISLAGMNDKGTNFNSIADMIEARA